jgi:hypothetical protein
MGGRCEARTDVLSSSVSLTNRTGLRQRHSRHDIPKGGGLHKTVGERSARGDHAGRRRVRRIAHPVPRRATSRVQGHAPVHPDARRAGPGRAGGLLPLTGPCSHTTAEGNVSRTVTGGHLQAGRSVSNGPAVIDAWTWDGRWAQPWFETR